MRSSRSLVSTLLALAVTAAISCVPSAASADVLSASTSDSFVNSIGVNTHLTYNNTDYGETAKVIAALENLGVRHIREGLALGRPDQYLTLAALAHAGIHATLIMGYPGFTQLPQLVNTLATAVPNPDAVEGPNEYDQSGQADWASQLRSYVRLIHSLMQGQPTLSHVTILGPSLTSVASFGKLGPIGGLVDGTAIHPYPIGQIPEGVANIDQALAERGAAGKPVEVTESGYTNYLGHAPVGVMPGVSERASGIYLPRLFLTNYAAGIKRTFSYELLDENLPPGPMELERHFGLLHQNFTPKPAYLALQRMIHLLSDQGSPFSASDLNVGISGDTGNLRKVLLERRDGTYELALWRSESVFNTTSMSNVFPADQPVTVRLPSNVSGWSDDRISQGSGAAASGGSTSSITIPVGADVSIVELRGLSPVASAARIKAGRCVRVTVTTHGRRHRVTRCGSRKHHAKHHAKRHAKHHAKHHAKRHAKHHAKRHARHHAKRHVKRHARRG